MLCAIFASEFHEIKAPLPPRMHCTGVVILSRQHGRNWALISRNSGAEMTQERGVIQSPIDVFPYTGPPGRETEATPTLPPRVPRIDAGC